MPDTSTSLDSGSVPDAIESQPVSQQLQTRAKAIVEVALVLIGLAYLSGFLVVFTFQSRLGIHDANAEILRIRYIYTGLMCLAFPLFVLIPVSAHMWMFIRQRQHMDEYVRVRETGRAVGRSRLSYTVQLLCVSICLLMFVLFEPYGAFHAHLLWVTLLLGSVVIPVAVFPKHLGFAAAREYPVWRAVLAASSMVFLYFAFVGTIGYLATILWKGRAYWMFMAALTYYVVTSASRRVSPLYHGQSEGAQLARWAIVITLAILSTLAFAYRLYPYIPADKGGGNYHFSRDARLCVTADATLPALLRDVKEANCSVTVKVLEITDTTVYAARSDDRGTDDTGQGPGSDGREAAEIWSDGQYFPAVYAISRNKIGFIQYQMHVPH
jgi:hypothetical protein